MHHMLHLLRCALRARRCENGGFGGGPASIDCGFLHVRDPFFLIGIHRFPLELAFPAIIRDGLR